MPQSIQIRSNGTANSQVVDEVKAALAEWLRDRGVSDAHRDITESNVLFTHFNNGNHVAVSNQGVSDVEAFNGAYRDAVNEYWNNRAVGDDCFWVHREWIAELMDTEAAEGSQTTVEG